MAEKSPTFLIATTLFPILVNEQYIYIYKNPHNPYHDEHMYTVEANT